MATTRFPGLVPRLLATLLPVSLLLMTPSPAFAARVPAFRRHFSRDTGPWEGRGYTEGQARAGIPSAPLRGIAAAVGGAAGLKDSGAPLSDYQLTEEVATPIKRPPGVTPCVVTLIKEQNFSYFEAKAHFSYAPPAPAARCGATWQLVVLSVSAHITGRQFDRRMVCSLRNVTLLVATTAEPRKPGVKFGVERDLTEYSALLRQPGPGWTQLGNVVDDTYVGIYYVTIQLLFYPGTPTSRGLLPPDVILPVPSPALRIPRNTFQAELEVYVSHYQTDEFYYGNVPQRYYDTLSPEDQQTQSNGSSFREVVAFLDGVPVGAIFHQPLVYSGGMNPLFWRPFMAMGSLNMPTYTLDVTPFLGRLLGGGAHRIEFGVAAAGPGSSWITAGALKVWTDPKVTATSAGLSFAKFPPLRLKDEVSAFGTLNTVITTRAARKYDAAGYVVSSRGNVTTRVKASFAFVNTLSLSRDGLTSSISYKAATSSALSRKAADGRVLDLVKEISSFPLDMQFDTAMFPDDSGTQYARIALSVSKEVAHPLRKSVALLQNTQTVSSYSFSGNDSAWAEAGGQSYNYTSALGCYMRTVGSNITPMAGVQIFLDAAQSSC